MISFFLYSELLLNENITIDGVLIFQDITLPKWGSKTICKKGFGFRGKMVFFPESGQNSKPPARGSSTEAPHFSCGGGAPHRCL